MKLVIQKGVSLSLEWGGVVNCNFKWNQPHLGHEKERGAIFFGDFCLILAAF